MLPQLGRQLLAKWPQLPVQRAQPRQLSFLGTRTGIGDGYALFMGFCDGDTVPYLMIKIPREPAAVARLQHEWVMLNRLQELGPRMALPIPLAWEPVGGTRALVTTAPQGRPVTAGNGLRAKAMDQVGGWLVRFACATRSFQSATVPGRDLEAAAERSNAIFQLSVQETAVIEGWISRWLSLAREGRVSMFAIHGNLNSRNVWCQDDRMTIVNWEQSSLVGLHLDDLFMFMTTWALPDAGRLPREPYRRAFRATYLSDGPYGDLVCRTIVGYCHALDIPTEGIEPSFGIFVLRAALNEYDRLVAAAERGYLPLLSDPDHAQRPPYHQALRNQIWVDLLRLLIQERSSFRPGAYSGDRRSFQAPLVPSSVLPG
jgi:hypothetical protein